MKETCSIPVAVSPDSGLYDYNPCPQPVQRSEQFHAASPHAGQWTEEKIVASLLQKPIFSAVQMNAAVSISFALGVFLTLIAAIVTERAYSRRR